MNERPEDRRREGSGEQRSGERRRGGPLGEGADETVDQSAQTRREPPRSDDATQQIPTDEATRQIPAEDRSPGGRRDGRGRSRGDTQEFESPSGASTRDAETRRPRSVRSSGRGSDGVRSEPSAAGRHGGSGYSTGYNDVLRDREEYLRDIYGGIDWLASFVGFVFTLLCAALFGGIAVTLLLVPLGLQQSLSGGQLNSTALTGFAVVAGVIFLAFLFGGYISGRMARYDGARNGAMVLLWTVLVAVTLVVLSGLLSNAISGTFLGDLVGGALAFSGTAQSLLTDLGGAGGVIAGGVLLVALLGGMLGGRLGSRYHREIDYTP